MEQLVKAGALSALVHALQADVHPLACTSSLWNLVGSPRLQADAVGRAVSAAEIESVVQAVRFLEAEAGTVAQVGDIESATSFFRVDNFVLDPPSPKALRAKPYNTGLVSGASDQFFKPGL